MKPSARTVANHSSHATYAHLAHTWQDVGLQCSVSRTIFSPQHSLEQTLPALSLRKGSIDCTIFSPRHSLEQALPALGLRKGSIDCTIFSPRHSPCKHGSALGLRKGSSSGTSTKCRIFSLRSPREVTACVAGTFLNIEQQDTPIPHPYKVRSLTIRIRRSLDMHRT